VRPAHLLHHYLRRDHVRDSPVLAHLGALDAALDALLLALGGDDPSILRAPAADAPLDLELRRARTVAALALALQSAMYDYQDILLERLDRFPPPP
jgi:hypothetical protein